MKIKRILCVILSIALIAVPLSATAAAADIHWQPKNKEPIVFVHGLNGWGDTEDINDIWPYWGGTTGNLIPYLQHEGYDCHAASVGPMSSAWDRACELYAQIRGTRVDYGVAHSAKFNHARYGRTYLRPMIPNWGELDENEQIRQIHLVGHSFGGTTIRLMVQLLTSGSPEEIAATSPEDISGLFTGGKGNWVRSVTTICTPHNSATIYYPLVILQMDHIVQFFTCVFAGIIGRSATPGVFMDFQLEQFGITRNPDTGEIGNFLECLKNVRENSNDLCIYDMSPKGNAELNEFVDVNENIYYFSYAFSTTEEIPCTGTQFPIATTNPVISLMAAIMGCMRFKDPYTGEIYDEKWFANDSMVNVESARYPHGEPHKDYDKNDVPAGVWNVMPLQVGDHGTAIGLLADKDKTHEFYIDLCEMICALPYNG